jgi:hypothetical protein
MIDEKEIVFVTNSLHTKWMNYQSSIIKKLFPNSEHIIIDGNTQEFRSNWPNSWFYWIDEIKKSNKKYYIHIDEDFFITSKIELLNAINKFELNNIDLMGCSEGYHHFRGANPVAINTFFMIGRISDIKKIDNDSLRNAKYTIVTYNGGEHSWLNSLDIKYKEQHAEDFHYPFDIQGGSNFKYEQEPYYAFLWSMKELGCKFDYLYPHFDVRFKSTNPRLEKESADIGIHMWYTRHWESSMDVHGVPNYERYQNIENYLNNTNDNFQ